MHFYIIFGTNLQTRGPVQIAVFAYFSVSQKRNIKRNPNGMKRSRGSFLDKRNLGDLEWMSRKQRGVHEVGECAQGAGTPPTLVGPSLLHQPTSFAYIYSYTLKTSESTTKPYFHRRNLLYP